MVLPLLGTSMLCSPWPRGQFWLLSIDPIQLLASFTFHTVWQIVESIGPNLLRIFTGILDKITQFLRKSVEEIPSFSLLRRQKMQNILLIRGQRLVCLKLILNTVVVNFELCLTIICKSSPMQFCRLELKRTLLTTYCCAPIRVSQTDSRHSQEICRHSHIARIPLLR